jgi:hypothetical protein
MQCLNEPLNCGCPDVNPCEGRHGLPSCNNCESCCDCSNVALYALIESAHGGTDLYSSWTDVVRFMWFEFDMPAREIAYVWQRRSLPGQVFYNYESWSAACSVQCLHGSVFGTRTYASYVEDLPDEVRSWVCSVCADHLDPDYVPSEGECSGCGDEVYYADILSQLCEDCERLNREPECPCQDSHIIGDGTQCARVNDTLPAEFWSQLSRLNVPYQLVIWTPEEITGVDQLVLI